VCQIKLTTHSFSLHIKLLYHIVSYCIDFWIKLFTEPPSEPIYLNRAGTRQVGRCDTRSSRIIREYRLSQSEAF